MTTLAVETLDTALVVSAPAPTQLVVNLDPPAVLEVAPSGATLAVQVMQAGVLTAPAAQGATGPKGDKGDPGIAAAPTLWPINNAASFTAAHGLPYPPRSLLLDASGAEMDTDTLYAPGQVTLVFAQPFTGTLYLG